MPVLTICNHKGGTGKTTSVINLSAAIGLSGRRVLVVDLDPQGFLTHMMGVAEPPPEHSSLALIDKNGDLRTLPTHQLSGFDLLPASQQLTKAQRKLNKPTDVFWLKETLEQGHSYDLVVLDTAAAVSVYTLNALVASQHVLIPVTPEYQPIVGAEQTWQTSITVTNKLNPALNKPRLLLTQIDARKRDHREYAAYLRGKYGEDVLENEIRTSASLAETTRDGKTVFDHEIASRGALDYANSADEVMRFLFAEPQRDEVNHIEFEQYQTQVPGVSSDKSVHSGGGPVLKTWTPLDRL